jgi:hypothetical protein
VKHVVSPSLFEGLVRYAEAIENGTNAVNEAIEPGSELIAFLNGFFEQFFRNVLATEIRDAGRADAALARRLRAVRRLTDEQRTLLMAFEDYCAYSPDIFGSDYGGEEYLFQEFHEELMVYLVDDIVSWAATTDDRSLIEAASEARDVYQAAAG